MKRYGVQRIAFINKMDRTEQTRRRSSSRSKRSWRDARSAAGCDRQRWTSGTIDLLTMQAVYFEGEKGETVVRKEIPAEPGRSSGSRTHMLEAFAVRRRPDGCSVEEQEPELADLKRIIRQATLSQEITPVMMGTAYRNCGVQELLDRGRVSCRRRSDVRSRHRISITLTRPGRVLRLN